MTPAMTSVSHAADLAADLKRQAQRGPIGGSSLLLFAALAVVGGFFWWAAQAELQEVAAGTGKVIPSQQIQMVQNLEGGIIAAILVKDGDVVQKNQILLRIDNTGSNATLRQNQAEHLGLLATEARLVAEIDGTTPVFSDTLTRSAPEIVANQRELFVSRLSELRSSIDILERQVTQRRQELAQAQARAAGLESSLGIARQELGIVNNMVAQGASSQVEHLRIQRQVSDLTGELNNIRASIPRAQAAIAEAERRILEKRSAFRNDALSEMGKTKVRIAALAEAMEAMQDRVVRTEVRAPVTGTVNKLNVATIGAVVQPGATLAEIVPLEDTLLIEARVKPSDIAFLRPGQAANVKFTAYDSSIYGYLPAKLEQIGADTVTDSQGNAFYNIRVRTERSHLGSDVQLLPIIPGMVTEVDVLTGKRTVLDYMLKPLIKVRDKAFRER
jgi:adhesin transport system membrane fusion protein